MMAKPIKPPKDKPRKPDKEPPAEERNYGEESGGIHEYDPPPTDEPQIVLVGVWQG